MPKTPSFVTEIELKIDPHSESVLNVRFDCARQIYNACLGEALIRLRLMKDSPLYKAAKAMPRTINKEANLARQGLFAQAREIYEFSDYSLQAYAKQFGHSWLGDHVDSLTVQKIDFPRPRSNESRCLLCGSFRLRGGLIDETVTVRQFVDDKLGSKLALLGPTDSLRLV